VNIQLKYFTGTGNSLKILTTIKNSFSDLNHSVQISRIKKGEIIPECDIIGFCFPIYAFGIPRIARIYLQTLPVFDQKQKAFVIVTAGDRDESGFSIRESIRYLSKKNCEIIYTSVIQMPINWIAAMNPPAREEAEEIIIHGIVLARKVASDILQGKREFHQFNIPKRYGRFGLYREYLLFKYLGIKNLWRVFKVYETCSGCQLCVKACPTNSISFVKNKPVWSSSCEQCMRCINICPQRSIFQNNRVITNERNRYLEPDFRPLID
jgi:ferredoxin